MIIRPNRILRPATYLLATAALSLGWMLAMAQPQFGGRGKGVGFSDYDAQNRIKSQIFAGEALPKGSNTFEIKGLKVELYGYEKGYKATNLIVNATNCLYDKNLNVASSPQQAQAVSGDGSFKLSGVGFRYEQASGKLVLSNQVRVIIRKDMFDKKKETK